MVKNQLIQRDPEIMSGTPVFRGTRVPVQTLIDYLSAGDTLEEFQGRFSNCQTRASDCSFKCRPGVFTI